MAWSSSSDLIAVTGTGYVSTTYNSANTRILIYKRGSVLQVIARAGSNSASATHAIAQDNKPISFKLNLMNNK